MRSADLMSWAVLSLLLGTNLLQAFDLRTDASGVFVVKWYDSPVPIEIHLPTARNLSDGSSQASTVAAAINIWNTHLVTLRLEGNTAAVSQTAAANDRNEIVMSDTVDGDPFAEGVLAITMSYSRAGNAWGEADIVFNSGYEWDSYRGNLTSNGKWDMRRVALHELGHLIGLDHPDEAGQSQDALMNSHVGNRDGLQLDDINGAHALYGVPGFTATNDRFAEATDITSIGGSNSSFKTSNIGASRESGEPAHADVTFGHSLWWSWTAPYGVELRVSTLGSDFDTVLAVYTGSDLGSLSLVGSNDDEETPEENSAPSRRRTSVVDFIATAGTTYFFAVDGWGDVERFPAGATGQITLSLDFGERTVPPRMIVHPKDETIALGGAWFFEVRVEGYPTPVVLWQHAHNGGDWVDLTPATVDTPLVGGGAYRYVDHGLKLFVSPLLGMEGDLFRCIATNVEGSVTSEPATLRLYVGPTPEFYVQPINVDVVSGSGAFLGSRVYGDADFQWYHNGQPIEGATSSFLWLADPQSSDAGDYYVTATNVNGVSVSDIVAVTVTDLPSVEVLSSRRIALLDGESGTLRCGVPDTSSATVRWYHDGREIPGADTTSLTITMRSQQDAGAYWMGAVTDQGTRYGPPIFVVRRSGGKRLVAWERDFDNHEPSAVAVSGATTILKMWGDSGYVVKEDGGLGVVGVVGSDMLLPDHPTDYVDVAATSTGALALRADGTVVGSPLVTYIPPGLHNVVDIEAGVGIAAALRSDGTVVSWSPVSGLEGANQIYPGEGRVVEITLGGEYAIALLDTGRVKSWVGRPPSRLMATSPENITDVVAIAAGSQHAIALRRDGSVVGWGYNYSRQTDIPYEVYDVVEIHAADYHSVVRRSDGTIIAWGGSTTFHPSQPSAEWGNPAALTASGDRSYLLLDSDHVTIDSRLVNLSVRSPAGTGDQSLVLGFVIQGELGIKTLLRGIGPGLTPFGVTGVVEDPQLKLFGANSMIPEVNDDWGGSDLLKAMFASVGAFPLAEDSRDAVLYRSLWSTGYTAHVSPSNGQPGIALIELYDLTKSGAGELSNLSARTVVGRGLDVLVAGFVLEGDSRKRLLIRAVGPSLAQFGLSAANLLSDPRIDVRKGAELVASNDNWSGESSLKNAFGIVGAFALDSDVSLDSAAVVTLEPGAYTVTVSGADDGTGVALIEIYLMP